MTSLKDIFDTVGIYLTPLLMAASGLAWLHGRFARNTKVRGGLQYLRLIVLNRGRTVRFSSSALLTLTHNDHYLMIRSRTGTETYWAPVGGVLKRHSSSSGVLRELDALPDVGEYPDDDRDCDLRLFVPAKKFRRFLDWYDESTGRETVETRPFARDVRGARRDWARCGRMVPKPEAPARSGLLRAPSYLQGSCRSAALALQAVRDR